ncbi:hypothetical protein M2103_000313 [Ereboglobus sp. PH5-5]|uniref:hypothetical protein n=1 Tax=Ereboglobus sp. PH5-5 TaxID=2940529 RepID=UPI002405EE42|nr:hypothetical protein [Ereboglobus sp. PH5-5]MDF9832105.1 hypothetical protein [Ereboglobus sp. PH5-5]
MPAKTNPSTPHTPRPGDIFVQRSADTGRYCAYQITLTENASPHARGGKTLALLSLDWVGDALPTEADLAAMRPLNNTRYYWGHGLDYRIVTPPVVPATFQFIANRPSFVTKQTTSFGGWPPPSSQAAEQEADWRARDPERLRRFEAARGSGREFTLAGQTVRDTFTHAGPGLLDGLANLAELDKLPRLLELEARGPRPDLIAYLRTHDLLHRVIWNAHGARTLDFRGVPHVHDLELDATGLETLHLHDNLCSLKLTGALHPRLRIHAHDDGARIRLNAPPSIAATNRADPGLPNLSTIRIEGIDKLDLAPIVARHPALETLSIAGKPGTLQNVSAISRLPKLRSLYIDDLFGYEPADIPQPGTHPRLAELWLESIPADVAAHVKTTYAPLKKTARLDLQVRKPRAPEWLADNLDNPFRAWDGDEFVSPANARRAATLYKKTRAELRARLDSPDAATALPEYLEQLVREWAAAFNTWDKRTNWIETEERETICEVVDNLLAEAARRHPAANIDTAKLSTLFDELRDF